jgi:hypothetical protein
MPQDPADDEDRTISDNLIAFLRERHQHEHQPLYTQVVVISAYLDEDGDQCWSAHTAGDATLSATLGLIELGRAWLIQDLIRQNGGRL